MASGVAKTKRKEMKPEILTTRVLWEGNFLRAIMITYRNSKQNLIPWEVVQRVGVQGIVVILPFTKEREVILTKQFRPAVNKYVIEFPAGLSERDESLEEAAKRELLEETGYRTDNVKFIAEGPVSPGASSEILTVYLAEDVVNTGRQRPDGVEEIEVIKLSSKGFYEKLQALINSNSETCMDLKIPGLYELAIRELKNK